MPTLRQENLRHYQELIVGLGSDWWQGGWGPEQGLPVGCSNLQTTLLRYNSHTIKRILL